MSRDWLEATAARPTLAFTHRVVFMATLVIGCSSATTLMTNRLEFDCQKLSKRPDMISQPSGHAGCSVSPPGLDESRGVGLLLRQRHAQTHVRPGEVVEGLNLVVRSDNSRSEAEPYRLCRQRLAGYKQPQGLHFIVFDAFDAFPRSASGKVQRHELPARLEQER